MTVTACRPPGGISKGAEGPGAMQALSVPRVPAEGSVVLVAQGVGHHADQLLPGGLAGRGELLPEVGSQDDDEDVTQELQGRRRKIPPWSAWL